MLKRILTASALGLAALTVSAIATPSAALPRTDLQLPENTITLVRYGHAGHFARGGHFHRFYRARLVHGGFRPRRFVRRGGGVYGYFYGGGCAWLHQRAIITGNPYWWRRYRLCRGWY
jgi:hypothetical protein